MEKHDTILLVSASDENRRHLRTIMERKYNLLEAVSRQQALMLLRANIDIIAAVMVGTTVLENGYDKGLKTTEAKELFSKVSCIVMLEGEKRNPAIYFRNGAADVVSIDYDSYSMGYRIDNIIKLHLHRHHLEELYMRQEEKLRNTNDTLVDALSTIIEYRNTESGRHIKKIRGFTRSLLRRVKETCPEYQLTDDRISMISGASSLHDIGKIAIPDSILMKQGPLTTEEMNIMRTHTIAGCGILGSLTGIVDREYLRYAYNICRHHHERWDGGGYPDKFSGDDIPICAQVVGLADAYEALTSDRAYKEAFTHEMAANMIIRGDCGEFSPKLIECFKAVLSEFRAILEDNTGDDGNEYSEEDFAITPVSLTPAVSGTYLQAKFNTLVHFIGGLLIDFNLDHNTFHVVYNPYTSLLQLSGITTLEGLLSYVAENMVATEEKESLYKLFRQDIYEYIRQDIRRVAFVYHLKDEKGGLGVPFEMTFLRTGTLNRRSFAILCRLMEDGVEQKEHDYNDYPLAESAYICLNDGEFTLTETDPRLRNIGGYGIGEIKEKFNNKLINFIHPDDREMVRREYNRQLAQDTSVRLEHRVVLRDGSVMWVANKSYLEIGKDGREYLHCFLTNIDRTRSGYENLKKKLLLYREILVGSQVVLFDWDVPEDTVSYSDTYSTWFTFDPPKENLLENINKNPIFHPDDVPLLVDKISGIYHGKQKRDVIEVRMTGRGGRYEWIRFRAEGRYDSDGRPTNIYGMVMNINEEKEGVDTLMKQAEIDGLTGLLNKAAIRKKADEYLAMYPNGADCAMLIIDIDNFKQINDTYGHLFGDSILTRVAEEISTVASEGTMVARIGGDEFLVLSRGLSDKAVITRNCRLLIEKLENVLNRRYWKTPVSCSIGVAIAPQHGKTYLELFENCDRALYTAKAEGKGRMCIYDPSDSTNTGTQLTAFDERKEYNSYQENFLFAVFSVLYNAKSSQQAVDRALAYIGRYLDVSRVYIFENSPDGLTGSNTFEWCNAGIRPEIQNLQNVSYENDIPGYLDCYDDKGIFYCPDITKRPQDVYDIVRPQGIKSMLHCKLYNDDKFTGYIGFDECNRERLWTQDEIDMLVYCAGIISMFLTDTHKYEELAFVTNDLQTILDNQNAWIYIIDPDTHEVKYKNKKLQAMTGHELAGKCYREIMGSDRPCEGCPAHNIRAKGTDSVIINDPEVGGDILAEATMISWQGTDSCLMSCRRLPK